MPANATDRLPRERSAYSPIAWERRKQPRLKLSWPVLVFHLTGDRVIETRTHDLCSTGFYFLCPTALEVSTVLGCILSLPAHDTTRKGRCLPLHCRVRIVRVDHDARNGLAGIACCIEDYHFVPPAEDAAGPPHW